MSIKKIKIISAVVVFLLAFPFHFVYEFFPSHLTAIFFPVNESIWEHMKLLYTGFLAVGILEHFCYKHWDIKVNNFLFTTWTGAFISVPLYLMIYLPVYYSMKEAMWWNLLCMAITIMLVTCFEIWALKQKPIKWTEWVSIPLMVVGFIIFGFLTFYPIHCHLFFDTVDEKYGISEYKVVIPKNDEYYEKRNQLISHLY